MKLGTTVILMVSAVLFSVLLVVHLIYFSQISNMTRDALASKALAVARTLANSPEIRQGLMKKPEESGIQAIAQAVNKSNDFCSSSSPICKAFVTPIPKHSESASRLKAMTFCWPCKAKRMSPLIADFWLKPYAYSPLFMTNITSRLAWCRSV
jgi:hypothetical protein